MEDESRAESPVLEKRAPSNHCSPIHIILSIFVAMAAIFASYLMVMSDEAQEDEVVVDETTAFDDEFWNLIKDQWNMLKFFTYLVGWV